MALILDGSEISKGRRFTIAKLILTDKQVHGESKLFVFDQFPTALAFRCR